MATTRKSQSLKTSPASLTLTEGVVIKPSSKRSVKPKFQCLLPADGQTPEWYEAEALISLGCAKTLNITECHNEESVCLLSQILQDDAPQKYSLSPKACAGILKRAQARGKELPTMLKAALTARAAELTETSPKN